MSWAKMHTDYLSSGPKRELCKTDHTEISGKCTPGIIARIYSLLLWLPSSGRKKNREGENTFLIGALCFKIFLFGMKEMFRGKMSSFLSSAATICKCSSNIFENLN